MERVAGGKRMSKDSHEAANILQLSIHGVLIGYLAGFKKGRKSWHFQSCLISTMTVVLRHAPRADFYSLMLCALYLFSIISELLIDTISE